MVRTAYYKIIFRRKVSPERVIMIIKTNDKITSITATSYSLAVDENHISVILAGEEVANLHPASAVDTVTEDNGEFTEKGDIPKMVSYTHGNTDGGYTFIWTAKSSQWDKTEYILTAKESHFEYNVRVTGRGRVDKVKYFSGDVSDCAKISTYEFDTGFTPIPTVNGAQQCTFSAQNDFDEFSFLTVPPMFVYCFDICGMAPKLAFGLVAERGEHNFTKFAYATRFMAGGFDKGFYLWTDQDGHTRVDGTWTTPTVIVYGAPDRMESLRFYSDYYFATGRADAKKAEKKPRFWYGPMACGWVEQEAQVQKGIYTLKENQGVGDAACQPVYDHFCAELERRDLHPQILIIDDKWQTKYGSAEVDTEKWPDLRGWIDEKLEKKGIRTMLWYRLWDADGVPEEMTMYDEKGEYNKHNNRRTIDPTNPKYREFVRKQIHRLISSDEGCVNAFGFKLDYAFVQPTGRRADSYSGAYGVELFYEYVKLIYECVKEAKPEAIVNASPCHPIFAAYVDHARLHDYYPWLRRCNEEFKFRRDLYVTAMPGVLVDTDGAAFRSHRDTMRYMKYAPEIGIPDLYCISDLPTITLTDEDWKTVANVWKAYSERIDNTVE